MRKYMCYATICPEKRKCELCTYCHRYVRADVAMRYARMRERKGYYLYAKHGVGEVGGIRWTVGKRTYEEAQQAAQREGII